MPRRLFWKVYATLLASLVAAALAFALLSQIGGSDADQRWPAFQARLLEATIPADDVPPGETARAVARLAKGLGGRVEVFAPSGSLVAAAGQPTAGPDRTGSQDARDSDGVMHEFMLADGRIVRAQTIGPRRAGGGLLFVAMIVVVIGLAAWPVVAQLTRRLERVRAGVALWGTGSLSVRVPAQGDDEVAAVAAAFNDAADRVERLLESHRSLLAHASHELRSPLARLRMAIELNQAALPTNATQEIVRNLAELDDLVAEILLSSRLDHDPTVDHREPVDLLALAAEEAARVGAQVVGIPVELDADPRLLRRLLRNLLENARKHGVPPIEVELSRQGPDLAVITVRDHGPGIAETERDRVFEPFYRPLDRSEAAGSWGLGLTLVRQIAHLHGGTAFYARSGEGPAFVVTVPISSRSCAAADA